MKCPVCNNVDLLLAERQGVEIDYCPNCRGIWLDRGELDKIIERSFARNNQFQTTPPPYQQAGYGNYPDERRPYGQRPDYDRQHDDRDNDEDDDDDSRNSRYGRGGKNRRRGGFLDDFLDFG